jgi:hypothetical protein
MEMDKAHGFIPAIQTIGAKFYGHSPAFEAPRAGAVIVPSADFFERHYDIPDLF